MGKRFSKKHSFRRLEVVEVTGSTLNQLQSLERSGLVMPHRFIENGRTIVAYTRNQLLQIKSIRKLREEISSQQIRSLVNYLNENGFDNSLYNKHLVVIGNEVFWVKEDWSNISSQMATALKVASKRQKGVGQYMLLVIPPLIDAVEEIKKAAKRSKVVNFPDFEQRFNAA
jgi:DNA-binding transcriptional MerR regulator